MCDSLSRAVADSATLADAAATALGNRVQEPGDIERALEVLEMIPGVLGGAVVMGSLAKRP